MRLVGKRSVASALRWCLGAANVLVTIGFVVVVLAAASLLVVPGFLDGMREGFSDGSDDLNVRIDDSWGVLMAVPALGFVWLVINRLRRILASVNLGDAFERDNVRRLQTVGAGLIGLQLTSYAETLARPLMGVGGGATLDLNANMWLAIVVVFILAEVFRQGAQMRDDAQMTV